MPNLDTFISIVRNSKRTLFILCGFPYAGKSYIANELHRHTDTESISIDTIFHAHGFDWDTNALPNTEQWQEIFDESYEKIRIAIREGKNVLYDSTNQTRESRDRLRDVARSVGGDAYVVYIKSSIETVWKRWEENQLNPIRSVVSKDLVQMTIDSFEEPTEDEQVIVIDN